MSGARAAATDQFYSLLTELARRTGGPRRLRDCTGRDGWPRKGVYFFFEDTESRADGSPRVVRVGTHALTSASRATLWSRLRQHRGRLGGRNPGGGNHRASIFRAHVGSALIRSEDWSDSLPQAWTSQTRLAEWTDHENQVERQVSLHIGAMPFLWLAVPDRDDGGSDRGFIEQNSIALLSCRVGCPDNPSSNWLGRQASSDKVRQSGLWNSNHVDDHYTATFLPALASLIEQVDGRN